MTQLDQAVYTSARTSAGDGYQLVGKSPGVLDIDAKELSIWCPSHDALPAGGPPRSVNFFRLPSGAHCVSQTIAAGQEYSGRVGQRIYTHCLIATEETLGRFANDAFALLNAARSTGELEPQDVIPREMDSLRLLGKASAMNRSAVEQFCLQYGPRELAFLIDALLGNEQVAISEGRCCEKAFAAALACIPVECRLAFSFTTGLKHSPRRPFRLQPVGDAEPAHLTNRFGIACLDLESRHQAPTHPWAELIGKFLEAENYSALSALMIPPRPGLDADTLARLAERLGPAIAPELRNPGRGKVTVAQAHAPHGRATTRRGASAEMTIAPRSAAAAALPTEQVEMLESLDDAVFEAIAGKPGALEQLQKLWPQARDGVDPASLEESRVHYLEFAMKVWNNQDGTQQAPAQALAALDVICVVLEQ
ncbi:MAG: hypothetical protein KDA42_06595 [Planctomycetales bacterium]|nr:hypothetical protein [Planctomycetales bacterium]